MGAGFGKRLSDAVARKGPLCVGIDPHPELLAAWNLSLDTNGVERFARTVVDALADEVAVLKPQSAFFEAYGSAGIAVLEDTILDAREAGCLVLLDAKRGDIGSTMNAYAQAYLANGAPLEIDAITLSPYLGFNSLTPAIELAQANGKGVFVLARTSNVDSLSTQNAMLKTGTTIAQSIADEAGRLNQGDTPMGSVGLVVGATVSPGELDLANLNGPILAPGLGAQGATEADLRNVFGAQLSNVLPTTSRDVLKQGPQVGSLRAEARRVQSRLRSILPE